MTSADQNLEPSAEAREPARTAPRLVVGDDGSAAADVVWLWVNNHSWPGWRVSVVTARAPKIGPPVGAERATLHTWQSPHPRRLFAGDDVEVEHLFAETDPRLGRDTTGAAVERAVAALQDHGVDQVNHEVTEALTLTAEFDVRSVVLDAIAEQSPDLVALGARGTGGIRGLIVGSVASAVVHHAPCSVLVATTG